MHVLHHVIKKQHKSLIDKLIYVAAILQPLMTLPQIIQIYSSHNVVGISLATWSGYAILGLLFLAYGIKHRLVPIIVTQVLWFTLQTGVVIGILRYG